jgi:hypothetical protein
MSWRQKIRHLKEDDLITALRQKTIKGLDFNPQSKLDACDTCIKGKLTSKPRMVVKQAASTSRKARPLRHSELFATQKASDKVDVSEMRRRVKAEETRSQLLYPNERKKRNKQKYEPACKHRRVVKIEYRPGQLMYRRETRSVRNRDPLWVGPYVITKRVSQRVYGVQVGTREIYVNVEELKLCRATRQQLRQQRREKMRRLAEEIRRYNHPSPDADTLSEGEADASSSGSSYREDFCSELV